MNEFKTFDEKGNEINVKKEDFTLIKRDKKIHDTKFETKPTTFLKDAFKRFCKNKSSVVGAIIIGIIILLTIIVPIVSPHNIKTPSPDINRLPAKLFEAGTGFWDGTKKYTGKVYDWEAEAPADCDKDVVIKITDYRDEYTDAASKYASGGILMFLNDKIYEKGDDPLETTVYMQNYYKFSLNSNDNFVLSVSLSSEDGLKGCKLGTYRIILTLDEKSFVIKDWSKDYSDYEINLSDVLKENNVNGKVKARIRVELQPELASDGSRVQSYIGINKLVVTSSSTDESVIEELENISIDDANATILARDRKEDLSFDKGYWQSTGRNELYQAIIRYVDYIKDEYADKLGKITKTIGKSTMDDYIKAGYCEYDYLVGPESFKVLNEKKCPIVSVNSQSYNKKDKIYNIEVEVLNYKLKGYTSMPKFLFGTDQYGYDMLKLCFNGLRTSLILSICACAVCFIFGLCWGAISGYYGGNIDLIMERFCDILGGLPSIVMLTLAIFYLGQNIVTFGLALCLTGWMGTAGRTRTQFYRFKGREYILASRTLGSSDKRLIFKHILPNAMGTIITSSVLMIPSTIYTETSLTTLGLLNLDTLTFGTIIADNRAELGDNSILIIFPSIIISLMMISFNLFGNGLRDAFNPSLKGSE